MASRAISILEAVAARRPHSARRDKNIGKAERAGSALTGAVLLAWGISRRSISGAVAGVVGGALMYRGARGRSRLYEAVGISTATGTGPVERVVTIHRPLEEVAAFCRDLDNLSRILRGVFSVRSIDVDTPGEIFAWHGLDGPSGSLRFRRAPGDRGSEVRLTLVDASPAEVDEALRQIRGLLEAGELPTTEGQSAGRRHA